MADLIEHCGVVERTERDTVYVRITSRSACGTCKARQACGLAEAQDKIVAVVTPEAGQYAAGREVMVGVRRSAGVRAVVLAYVGALAVLLAVLAALIAVSRVGLKTILRGMKPILVIIIITAVLNLFYTPGAGEPLAAFWIFKIYPEGIWAAVYMILRIAMLIACTFLLTYTTSPILLTDGLEKLLGPLKAIRVPVHELAMMMSIALRFIPTLIEETDKIMSAQKARGADFDTGSLMQKARALVPLLVPLFISAFRRADELAVAMECRCYHGGEGRTRLRVLRFRGADVAVLAGSAALCVLVGVLRQFGL